MIEEDHIKQKYWSNEHISRPI